MSKLIFKNESGEQFPLVTLSSGLINMLNSIIDSTEESNFLYWYKAAVINAITFEKSQAWKNDINNISLKDEYKSSKYEADAHISKIDDLYKKGYRFHME